MWLLFDLLHKQLDFIPQHQPNGESFREQTPLHAEYTPSHAKTQHAAPLVANWQNGDSPHFASLQLGVGFAKKTAGLSFLPIIKAMSTSTSTDKPKTKFAAVKQAATYYSVSAMQTVLEFAVFAILQALGLATGIANGIAVFCSGTFNFLMNRNITFKASSNFWRSVALFVLLYVWNFLFGTWFIGWAEGAFGCPQALGKFITMAMQGIWGFILCKYVIFK